MFARNMFASQKSLAENGVMTLSGSGAPTDGTSGTGVSIAGPGSLYIRTNGQIYINTNTLASPTWALLPNGAAGSVTSAMIGTSVVTDTNLAANVLKIASGTITAAQIIGTAAGELGHANGVIMVPAAAAGSINQLISAILINDFSVAAYTGGGNTTVNIGGGGAALTGLVSNANFIQAAADKVIEFVPLAATFNTYTTANPINLVTAAAPTNPGTAAGVFRYVVQYRVIATGL